MEVWWGNLFFLFLFGGRSGSAATEMKLPLLHKVIELVDEFLVWWSRSRLHIVFYCITVTQAGSGRVSNGPLHFCWELDIDAGM
jgi:hypothetical protein